MDLDNKTAEYAITLRKKSARKRFGKGGTGLVLEKAFSEYGLHPLIIRLLSNFMKDADLPVRRNFGSA